MTDLQAIKGIDPTTLAQILASDQAIIQEASRGDPKSRVGYQAMNEAQSRIKRMGQTAIDDATLTRVMTMMQNEAAMAADADKARREQQGKIADGPMRQLPNDYADYLGIGRQLPEDAAMASTGASQEAMAGVISKILGAENAAVGAGDDQAFNGFAIGDLSGMLKSILRPNTGKVPSVLGSGLQADALVESSRVEKKRQYNPAEANANNRPSMDEVTTTTKQRQKYNSGDTHEGSREQQLRVMIKQKTGQDVKSLSTGPNGEIIATLSDGSVKRVVPRGE